MLLTCDFLKDLDKMQNYMDDFFWECKNDSRVYNPLADDVEKDKDYIVPKADTYELDDSYVLKIDLPGVDKKGLSLSIEGELLKIKGRLSSTEGESGNAVDYFRTFKLGNGINRDKISANIKNGVLSIILAKTEKLKPRKIDIDSE